MIALCTKCFPENVTANGYEIEVLMIVPTSPCAACGEHDDRFHGGTIVRLLGSDPREQQMTRASVI